MRKIVKNNLKNKKYCDNLNQIYLYYPDMAPDDKGMKIILGTAIASIIFIISFYIYIIIN